MNNLITTIIVVNWNGKGFISYCLEGLRKQTLRDFRTIVVDNGSTDGSTNFIKRKYPEIHVIPLPKNMGFAKANNIAISEVNTPYVGLLNNDAIPSPKWLESLVEALEKYPEAGMAASKMVFYSNPDRIDRAGDGYTIAGAGSLRGRGNDANTFDKEEWIFGASAGAALYRTILFKDIGGFDEDFFLLYEDVDLSFRAQLAGYQCRYVPSAVVRHMATRSIGYDSPVSVYYGHRNLEWTYIKNMPKGLFLKTLPLHLAYVLSSLVFFSISGRLTAYLNSKLDALIALRRCLEKRRKIQKTKVVSDAYLEGLLGKEMFADRLIRRLARGNTLGEKGLK